MSLCCWPWRTRRSYSLGSADKESLPPTPEKGAKPPDIKVTEPSDYGNGNPRNKCALQPGHSLMDWIRLGNSGKDLSGVGGRFRPVSFKELATHKNIENAWIAIRGRVYNITDYLDYHPGGADVLMQGAGTDATELFDKVHPWVNYESLLSKCLIGPLKSNEITNEELQQILFNDKKESTPKTKIPEILRKSMENLKNAPMTQLSDSNNFNSVSEGDLTVNKSSSESSLNVNESKNSEKSSADTCTLKAVTVSIVVSDDCFDDSEQTSFSNFKYPTVTLTKADSVKSGNSDTVIDGLNKVEEIKPTPPKFDWIQKTDTITFIFYTKPLCNPQCSINQSEDNQSELSITVSYDFYTYKFKLTLENSIQWPCSIVINHETGKLEVIVSKETPKVWKSFGDIVKSDAVEQSVKIEDNCLACTLVERWEINHNTSVLLLKCSNAEMISFPVGFHSRIFSSFDDSLSRPYTPVPMYMSPEYKPAKLGSDCLCFIIKKYDQGAVSTWLTSRECGNEVTITRPLGSFSLKMLQDVSQLCLIAAGTGLTPMLPIIQFALQRRNPRCKKVDLLFFNRSEKDILWHNQLTALSSNDERFQLTNILSEPSSTWLGTRGHINQAVLINYLSQVFQDEINSPESDTLEMPSPMKKNHVENVFSTNEKELFAFICGPTAFTQLTKTLLSGLGCKETQMHCFFG